MNKIKFLLIYIFVFITASCHSQTDELVLGNYKVTKVTDGDTFRYDKLDGSARLIFIDTEETIKGDTAEASTNKLREFWLQYYQMEKGDSKYPAKTSSPFGYDSWKWAEEFMKNTDSVRLERDDVTRVKDMFNRHLVYMIVYKDGNEINYNIEAVKQGITPYFNKYGNSKRFHQEFVDAQNYARTNRLGIWNDTVQRYPDYEQRIEWWNKRVEQLENFSKNYSNDPQYLNLTNDDGFAQLESNLDKEVIVFGNIGEVLKNRFPYLITIPKSKEERFELIVFESDKDVLDKINMEEIMENSIYVKGKLQKYKNRYQIVLKSPDQVWVN
jgi:endonuclease YncB( thermonuclease family)